MKLLAYEDITFVLNKIVAVQHNENFAGQTNVVLVYCIGSPEPIRLEVENGAEAYRDICDQLKKAKDPA
jgi:hypothetical protein